MTVVVARKRTAIIQLNESADSLSSKGEQVRRAILSGTRWSTVGQVGSQAVRLLVTLLLARLLAPSDFGLMAMSLVVIGFVELFKDLGTVQALVGARQLSPALVDSVFVLNGLVGLAAFAVIYAVAPAMARMYAQPELTSILRVMALTLIIASVGLAKRALLQRDLRFGRLAIIDLVAGLSQGLVAVVLAAAGFAVWSLVAATIASATATTGLLWFSSDWRPRLIFQWQQIKPIAQFSLSMSGSQILSYLISQADRLLIGVFLGDVALGLYSVARRLLETVLGFVTAPVMKVLYPALASIQSDNKQIGLLYTRACGTITLVTLPLLTGLAMLAAPFVLVVLGAKWAPAIPVLMILAVPTIIQCLATTVGAIYMVKSKAHWLLYWQIAAGALTTGSYLVGLQWGILGVGIAYAVAILLLAFPAFAIPFRLIELSIGRFGKALLPYVLATILMGGTIAIVRALLEAFDAPGLVVLLAASLVAGLTYLAGVAWLKAPALSDVAEFFLLRRPPRDGDPTTASPPRAVRPEPANL